MAARYITTAELISVLPPYLQTQLLDDDHDGVEDVGLAETIISDAADEVDAILSYRYHVPFDETNLPTLVRSATKRIARFLMHMRRSLAQWMIDDYELVQQQLSAAADPKSRDIVSGIGVDPEPAESSDTVGRVLVSGSSRVSTRDSWSVY